MIFTILHSLSFSKDQATCLSDLFSALCFPMGTFTAKSLQENQKLKDWRFQVHRKITCCFHNAVISATVSENPKQALCFPSCFVAPFSRLRAWKHFWCLILMLSVYFTQLRDLNTVKLAWIGIFKPHQHWLFSKFQTDSVEPTRAHRLMHLYFLVHMQIHQCVFVWYTEQLCSTDMQICMQSQTERSLWGGDSYNLSWPTAIRCGIPTYQCLFILMSSRRSYWTYPAPWDSCGYVNWTPILSA